MKIAFGSLLDSPDSFEKNINSILQIIENNCNVEELKLYKCMFSACKLEYKFNTPNPEISAKIEEIKENITPEKLQEHGQIDKKENLEIYSYFSEKSDYVSEMLSSIEDIEKINSQNLQEGKDAFQDCIDDDKTRLSIVRNSTYITKNNILGNQDKINTNDEQSIE